tara:strand:- start:119 stop:250 length:132 start_codon:yes stop_codon:yes gene_type:complete
VIGNKAGYLVNDRRPLLKRGGQGEQDLDMPEIRQYLTLNGNGL